VKCIKNRHGIIHTVDDDHWSLHDDGYEVVPCQEPAAPPQPKPSKKPARKSRRKGGS